MPACKPVPASASTYCSAVHPCKCWHHVAPGPIVGLVPEEPGHAGRLDADQHGTATEEDLIEAADQDQRPALSVEVLEDTCRLLSGRLDPALDRGAPGRACVPMTIARRTRTWLRLSPIAVAVTVNSCRLPGGNSMV